VKVVATAGHVDHGKSTLVRALTGTDPDRLPEEKARGLTIDLGFAVTTLASGEEIAFVDVPGHGRFVRNMLAGVGSAAACLFVVAATDGWKAQSEEHLRILELLGISDGVVVLTKVAVAGAEQTQWATLEIEERLASTFLSGREIVGVDVPAGIGVDALTAALDRLVMRLPDAADDGRPRLWIDRRFVAAGAGTIVTGTLTGGSIAVNDELVIEPGDLPVRVRGLQSHHSTVSLATPGRRLAVNLSGVSHTEIARGQALVRPGQWHLAARVDATLSVLDSLTHPVGARGAYTLYVGSGEFPVRMQMIGATTVDPGARSTVRYWMQNQQKIPLVPGDRYVLREAGRFETIGGGEILDVDPVLRASRAAPSRSVERVVAERGWVDAEHLARITGTTATPTVGHWVVDPAALAAAIESITDRALASGPDGVALAELSERERAVLKSELPGLVVRNGRVYAAGHAPQGLSEHAQRVLETLEAGRWSPPSFPPSDRGALRALQQEGFAVEAGGVWFAASAVAAAAAVIHDLLDALPEGFTVSQARDALGSSRKHVVPLLNHFDATGVTRRRGDERVGGPRLPSRHAH
jgi:selenocysteine-specific elongation factor